MITNNLINNIQTYIRRVGIVPKTQLIKMFSDVDDLSMIDICITSLVANNVIKYDEKRELFFRRQSVSEKDFEQKLITEAAWLLADMGQSRVRDFFIVEYPSQIFIISEDNICYDITVFTYDTLNALKQSVLRKRQTLLPQGVKDECVHIALVPDDAMADEIASLPFDSYCILSDDKCPNYHEFPGVEVRQCDA